MNNNIILKALQNQFDTVKADAIAHEQNVYEPALAKLQEKVAKWFAANVMPDLHEVTVSSDRISIKPSDVTGYGNCIDINYRGSWRGENSYFEVSSYRPDIDSREDNTVALRYYNCMASIIHYLSNICEEFKTKWLPAYTKLTSAKEEKYSEIYKVEREIRTIESQIAESEKEAYNKPGFECTLKPYATYDSDYSGTETVYTKKYNEHNIKAQYGRARWDYYTIHSFKVVSFPKAKHGKVVLEFKGFSTDEKTRTAELNKTRYAEFVNEVYWWQKSGAEQREADIDERIARWSKADA